MKISSCFILLLCMAACTNISSPQEHHTSSDTSQEKNSYFTFKSTTDSVVDGEHILYHKNGLIEMRGMMKNGKRDSVWKSWYANGLPWSETTFKDGVKEGKTTTWYDNGNKRYEGFFKNDKESGRWVFWNEDGTPLEIKNYDLK